MMCSYVFIACYLGINVSFNNSYTINENDGLAQPVIVLSHPSSFDVTLRVKDANISARS